MWAFYGYDLRSRHITAELPLADVTWSRSLREHGRLTATLPLPADAPGPVAAWAAATAPRRSGIIAERSGVPLWAGIVWSRRYDTETRTLTIDAGEITTVLERVHITGTLTFAQVDQFEIVRQLVAHAQAQPGADLHITVSPHNSGRLRDRTYPAADRSAVGEAVRRLSEVIDGFDLQTTLAWGGPHGRRLEVLWRLDHPRAGRPAAATGFVAELGRNAARIEWSEDGAEAADQVSATGGGDDDNTLVATATSAAHTATGHIRVERTISHRDVTRQATLDGLAQAELARRAHPSLLTPRITLHGGTDPTIGSWLLGDEARARALPGDDPFWPGGYDRAHRIIGEEVTIDGTGTEAVNLEFDPGPAL